MITTKDGSRDNNTEDIVNTPFEDLEIFSAGSIKKLLNEVQIYHRELNAKTREMQVSYERYFKLYSNSPTGFLTLSCDEKIVLAGNLTVEKKLGVNYSELIGTKFSNCIHASDQQKLDNYLHALLTQPINQKLRVRLNGAMEPRQEIHCKGIDYCNCTQESCNFSKNKRFVELRGSILELQNKDRQIILSITDVTESQINQEMSECLNQKLEQKIHLQIQELRKCHHELSKQAEEIKDIKQKVITLEKQPISSISLQQNAPSCFNPCDTTNLVINLGQLNAIFNAAVEGIITMDAYGCIISINQTVENIFGYKQQELVGCHVDKLIPKSEQSQFPYRRITDSYISLFNTIGEIRECAGLNKNNVRVPLEISVAQFILDGTPYLTAIVRDISARKLQEQREKEHLEELAHVTRLGLMGELASGIAHEINQPLTAVVNYVQACINLIHGEDYDRIQLVDIMKKSSDQALKAGQIIHRLRDLVKAKKIHQSMIDINNLVCNAVELCSSYLKQFDIKLQLELYENIPHVFADPVQIEQVILNLLKNSIDALSQTPYSRILKAHTYLNNGKHVEFRISDNGPGIEHINQEKIFSPFYTTKASGMGMGLSICRSIIEAHEGEIGFKINPEKGTTFYFSLPIRKRRQ